MGRQTTGLIAAAALALTVLATASCSGSRSVDAADAGRTRAYEPGVPNFDMEALVRVRDDSVIVETHLSMPLTSLVFVRDGDSFAAEYELVAQVIDRSSEDLVVDELHTHTLSVTDYDSTRSTLPHHRSLQFDVPPGEYVVEISVTDLETSETVTRRQSVQVPALGTGEPYVSRIHLEAQREGRDFEPLVSLHMPAMMDSLRASIQLLDVRAGSDLLAVMELVRFESDTTAASPPYWLVPSLGSLQYRGVFYDKVDTLQITRRSLQAAEGDAVVEFSLPRLGRGMYGLTISILDGVGGQIAERRRVLSVKNEAFPQIALLNDLVEALAYIAYEDEIEHIQDAESAAEKKRRFDAFWGNLVANRNLAANLLELYYGRVEEANLFFTSYKEGWKTDRGMVYVVMGPPLFVDHRVDTVTWYYSYSEDNPVRTFVFEKARDSRDDAFENFVLARRPYYQQEWSRSLDLWRSGDVL